MYLTDSAALKKATSEPIEVHQIDTDWNPIYRGDWTGINYTKVQPIK